MPDSDTAIAAPALVLRPIETAPRDGTFILLFGPSGYKTTPFRCEVGRYYPAYRPLQPWQTHSNDDFTDGGPGPTHWLPLPAVALQPLPDDAELFTRQDFGNAAKAGHYVLGEDGDACWATEHGYLPGWIRLGEGQTRPAWATHVAWFAK